MQKYGNILKTVIGVDLGGGRYTRFLFYHQTQTISGLSRFYHILCNYTLVFDFIGDSEFALTVYDGHDHDYFHDVEGNFSFYRAINEESEDTNKSSSIVSGSTIEGESNICHT